jgi:hypothetical protein
MAELYWAWQQYELPQDLGDIGSLYGGIANAMRVQGWQGIQQQQDLHGYKPGIDLFAAIVFLYIGGQSFWQVIAVGGGTGTAQQAQQEIQQLQSIIANLKTL